MLLLLAACTKVSPADRPACDSPEVREALLHIGESGGRSPTPLPPRLPADIVATEDIRQTGDAEVPQVWPIRAFSRLCWGRLVLADGARVDVGWDVFTTAMPGRSAWGIRPCVVGYDPQGRDCTAMRDGGYPGLPTTTPP